MDESQRFYALVRGPNEGKANLKASEMVMPLQKITFICAILDPSSSTWVIFSPS